MASSPKPVADTNCRSHAPYTKSELFRTRSRLAQAFFSCCPRIDPGTRMVPYPPVCSPLLTANQTPSSHSHKSSTLPFNDPANLTSVRPLLYTRRCPTAIDSRKHSPLNADDILDCNPGRFVNFHATHSPRFFLSGFRYWCRKFPRPLFASVMHGLVACRTGSRMVTDCC